MLLWCSVSSSCCPVLTTIKLFVQFSELFFLLIENFIFFMHCFMEYAVQFVYSAFIYPMEYTVILFSLSPWWGQYCLTTSLMTWRMWHSESQWVCTWHQTGESSWRVGLPFRGTFKGWMNGLTETSWSSKNKTKQTKSTNQKNP